MELYRPIRVSSGMPLKRVITYVVVPSYLLCAKSKLHMPLNGVLIYVVVPFYYVVRVSCACLSREWLCI